MLHSRTMTARNDTNSDVTSAPVALTKEYIRDAFKHLEETHDVEHRNEFFKRYMLEDVKWEITGNGHSLAGTRHSLADHSAASFNKLGETPGPHPPSSLWAREHVLTMQQARSLPVRSSSSCGASSSNLRLDTLVSKRRVSLPGPTVR